MLPYWYQVTDTVMWKNEYKLLIKRYFNLHYIKLPIERFSVGRLAIEQ